MRKFVFVVGLMMLSGMAFASPGGEDDNTGCNGKGNVNSPCVPGGSGGDNGGGGGGGAGGSAVSNADAFAYSEAFAVSQNENTNTNTVTNTATGGSVTVGDTTNTNTANGGEGGSAEASAVIAEGAVNVTVNNDSGGTRAAPVSLSTEYVEVRQAPSVAQGSFAISGCSVAGNAGGSNVHGSMFLGFGWTPQECYKFMLAQAYQSIGEKKAVCDILKNTKVGKRLERDGVTLPECLPQVVVIATPAPVDMTPYATKEEVNEKVDRAFRASQTK